MKKLNYLLSLAVLVIILASAGCGGSSDPGIPADDQVGAKLTSVWKIDGNTPNSVTFGSPSQDRTSDYSDFTLTITYDPTNNIGTYLIANGPSDGTRPFPSSMDTWSFSSDIVDPAMTIFPITRDIDDLSMNVELSESSLQLSFYLPEGGTTSRTEAVVGEWFFSFVRQ
ncbi:MAG TPA: hypothetical protein PKL31_17775 [Fulvivirga sp.]|nr:hypothetical protein [Fulvivirga sp.]